jgi:phage portal protein BeeE
MGVLEAHLNTLNLAAEQSRQARSVSTHGVPTGVLQSDDPDLEENEALEMKASWLRSQSTRSIAVLNANTKFIPLSWNPEQLELVESRKFTLTELELIFGLPVGWLGGQTSSRTYANIEQDGINLLKFSLGGHLARFEQTLQPGVPAWHGGPGQRRRDPADRHPVAVPGPRAGAGREAVEDRRRGPGD